MPNIDSIHIVEDPGNFPSLFEGISFRFNQRNEDISPMIYKLLRPAGYDEIQEIMESLALKKIKVKEL